VVSVVRDDVVARPTSDPEVSSLGWSQERILMRTLGTVVSVVVLVAVGAAGYVMVTGAHAVAPTSYWCVRALDRADSLDSLGVRLTRVQTATVKARHGDQVAKQHKLRVKLRNLEARASHAREEYGSLAARCRHAR
jgi:hypothetical protein